MTVRVAFEMPDHRFTMEFIGEVFQNQLYREGLFNTFIIAFF
jgi:iron(III) transport system permease protein